MATNAYTAAKGGMVATTELLALELGPHGVRVNSVFPGFVNGGLVHSLLSQILRE